jgi:hypothetical protein
MEAHMKKLIAVIILALIPGLLMAEGAVITEVAKSVGGSHTGMYTLTLAWTSDSATGEVEDTTSDEITAWLEGKWIMSAKTVPGTGGDAPTADYDITITDEDGFSIFSTDLNDRSATATEEALPYVAGTKAPRLITGALTTSVSAAGNSKTGKIILTIAR